MNPKTPELVSDVLDGLRGIVPEPELLFCRVVFQETLEKGQYSARIPDSFFCQFFPPGKFRKRRKATLRRGLVLAKANDPVVYMLNVTVLLTIPQVVAEECKKATDALLPFAFVGGPS
jgi:hypothetical protein